MSESTHFRSRIIRESERVSRCLSRGSPWANVLSQSGPRLEHHTQFALIRGHRLPILASELLHAGFHHAKKLPLLLTSYRNESFCCNRCSIHSQPGRPSSRSS